jgi:chromosome partitioning protein
MNAANLVVSSGGDEAEGLLTQLLAPVRETYDYIVIDTCPRLFDPTVSLALLAATHVLVPVLPEAFAVGGVQPLLGRIESFRDRNPDLRVLGLLPSRVPVNRIAARDALSALEFLPVPVFRTVIHEATEVNDAHNMGRPALATNRRTRTVEEYEQLAEEVETMLAVRT